MKKLSLLFLFMTVLVQSQTNSENHRKYWYYRTRLRNDFTKVGTNPGNSFVFNQRGDHFNGDFSNSTFTKLKEGDGTSTLGYYMAVLATEYRLLANNGQSLVKINNELYCALNAFNRVDYFTETLYGMPPSTNGFFLRDDIPTGYVSNNYSHFNYYTQYNMGVIDNTATRGFCSKIPNGMNAEESSWSSSSPGNVNDAFAAESQDQLFNLLFGLGMIATLVDQSASDNGNSFYNPNNNAYGSNQPSIKLEAKNITTRLLNYIKNSNGNGNGYNKLWKIYNPLGFLVSSNGGQDPAKYAYPLSQAGCFITSGSDELPITTEVSPHACPTNDPNGFNDNLDYNLTPGYSIFHLGIDNNGQGGTKNDLEGYYQNIGAVCNCYYQPVGLAQVNPALYNALVVALGLIEDIINSFVCHWGCPPWVEIALDNIIGALSLSYNINDTGFKLYSNEAYLPLLIHTQGVYDVTSAHPANGTKMYHGCYAHAIMHGNSYAHSLDGTMQGLINDAPCGGTFNYALSGWGNNSAKWSSDSRCDNTNRIGIVAESTGSFGDGGEFNGLDYMLYHNLFYLYNTNYSAVDISDRLVHFAFPIAGSLSNTIGTAVLPYYDPNNANGSHNAPANLGAFETIIADNTIGSNGDVNYRAGKTIHLISSGGNQQFHVANGANFHAQIMPFNCNSGDYQRSANNDSSKSAGSIAESGYTNAEMFDQATHGSGSVAWSPPIPPSTSEAIASATSNITKQLNSINSMISFYSKENTTALSIIDVIPNPSSGKTTLHNTNSNYMYTITDMLGNILINGQANSNTVDIDLSLYQKGIYFVCFDNGTGNKQTKKVVIN